MTNDPDPFDASRATASVDQILAALDPPEREAIMATFYRGLSYRQLALNLCVSEETIKARIRRGLAHMHRALSETAPTSEQAPGEAQPDQQPPAHEPRPGLCGAGE